MTRSLARRDLDGAFHAISRALKLNPDYIPANNAMALALLHIEDIPGAGYYAQRVRKLGGVPWKELRSSLDQAAPHHHEDGEPDPSAPLQPRGE